MTKWILIAALPIAAAISVQSIAQPAPGGPPPQQQAGPGDQPRPAGPDDRGAPGDDRRPMRPEDRGPGGPGGPGAPGGPGGPGMGGPNGMGGGRGGMPDPRRAPSMDTQRGYMELVRGYSDLSRDPSDAGVAAVITANDLLKPRGTDAAIEYFDKLLPNVKDPAIARAIRLQLVDLYRASNRSDEALKQLESLITAEPSAK